MPVAPATMFLTNRSWPGTSTMPRTLAAGERQMGKSQFDGDPALLLLLQTVGIDAGEGLDESGLAVVDMARGADDQVAHGQVPMTSDK